jgi:hypothetical protein
MSRIKSGVNSFNENDLYFGDGANTTPKRFFADNGNLDGYIPYLSFEHASNKWKYSNDGYTLINLLSGTYTTTTAEYTQPAIESNEAAQSQIGASTGNTNLTLNALFVIE